MYKTHPFIKNKQFIKIKLLLFGADSIFQYSNIPFFPPKNNAKSILNKH